MFLEISQKSRKKHLRQSLFLNKFAGLIKKETRAQVFSYEFCEVSKNTFSAEHVRATVSVYSFVRIFFDHLLYFLASLMTFSGTQRETFAGIFSPYSPPWWTRFTVASMSKEQLYRDRNIETIMERFCCTWPTIYSVIVRIGTNHNNSILFHSVAWLFHVLESFTNHMRFSNILS